MTACLAMTVPHEGQCSRMTVLKVDKYSTEILFAPLVLHKVKYSANTVSNTMTVLMVHGLTVFNVDKRANRQCFGRNSILHGDSASHDNTLISSHTRTQFGDSALATTVHRTGRPRVDSAIGYTDSAFTLRRHLTDLTVLTRSRFAIYRSANDTPSQDSGLSRLRPASMHESGALMVLVTHRRTDGRTDGRTDCCTSQSPCDRLLTPPLSVCLRHARAR